MPFHPCGNARLSSPDVPRIDLDRGDTYVVPLHRLAEVTRGSRPTAPLSRRYEGVTPGKYLDIEGPQFRVPPDLAQKLGLSEEAV